jgi:hypothetical protein
MSDVSVKKVSAFDADHDFTISFLYNGNQCYKNKLVIYDSATNVEAYSSTVTTYNLSQLVPAKTLKNGSSYYAKFTAYYKEASTESSLESSPSDVFKCLTTPSWSINISNGAVIGNSYYDLKATYSQLEGDVLNEFRFVVYNSSGTTFWISDTLSDTSSSVRVTGLLTDTQYYFRAYGTTVSGLSVDTRVYVGETYSDILAVTNYTVPAIYSYANLQNEMYQGFVKVNTNVASVDGVCSVDQVYVKDSAGNEYISLSDPGASVTFSNGFDMKSTYTLEFIVRGIPYRTPILTITGTSEVCNLVFYKTSTAGTYFTYASLEVKDSSGVWISNCIPVPSDSSRLFIYIKRDSGLFTIKIENLGEVSM